MIDLANIRSLTDFQRNAKQHVRRLKKSGQPEVLTVNGHAEVVVQSAAGYQKLLDAAEMAETLPVLRRSLEEADRGEGTPASEVLAEIRQRLKIKDRT